MSAQAWVGLVVGVLGFSGVILTVWMNGRAANRALEQQREALEQQAAALQQRANADDRGEAFRRITYCLDKMLSDRERDAAVGMELLEEVAKSPFITDSEVGMLRAATNRFSDAVAAEAGTSDTDTDTEDGEVGS